LQSNIVVLDYSPKATASVPSWLRLDLMVGVWSKAPWGAGGVCVVALAATYFCGVEGLHLLGLFCRSIVWQKLTLAAHLPKLRNPPSIAGTFRKQPTPPTASMWCTSTPACAPRLLAPHACNGLLVSGASACSPASSAVLLSWQWHAHEG